MPVVVERLPRRNHDIGGSSARRLLVITKLLLKDTLPLLFGAIDPNRIAASGHSIGGAAGYALAGGDDQVCDALWPVVYGLETLPYPPGDCISIAPDRRIKAMISLDGASMYLRWRELDRIAIPSLIMGETVENSEQFGEAYIGAAGGPPMRDWIARPHAATARPDSYRADVDGSNHYTYTNYCDAAYVFYNIGLVTSQGEQSWLNSYPCASTGLNAVTVSSANGHKAVTEYMTAFLNVFLGHSTPLDRYVLTPEFALSHKPTVQFFLDETCPNSLPSPTYFYI